MLGENALQRVIHALGVHIAEAKGNQAGQCGPAGSNQFPERKVMDQQNTSLLAGLFHNVWVWQPLQSLIGEMHSIVP